MFRTRGNPARTSKGLCTPYANEKLQVAEVWEEKACRQCINEGNVLPATPA